MIPCGVGMVAFMDSPTAGSGFSVHRSQRGASMSAPRMKRYLPMSGQIIDATLVAAPRQRNTDAEKARIKAGETAKEIWSDKPAKARQKDTDARGTVKFKKAKPTDEGKPQVDIAIPIFGYKAHISIDRRHGIIRKFLGTDAAAHDGARLRED